LLDAPVGSDLAVQSKGVALSALLNGVVLAPTQNLVVPTFECAGHCDESIHSQAGLRSRCLAHQTVGTGAKNGSNSRRRQHAGLLAKIGRLLAACCRQRDPSNPSRTSGTIFFMLQP
jgi:hypothetical protein